MDMESELSGVLEHAQLAETVQQKLPRRKLSRGVLTLLVLLRVYVVIAIPIVGYAFVHAINAAPH
jgi:hypothetical protein